RHLVASLLLFTGVKVAAVLALTQTGYAPAFVGDNAHQHYIPIADRLLAEGRFNGPESRPDSKVPIGYPAFLAMTRSVGGENFLTLVVCLQMACDLGVAALLIGLATQLGHRRAGVAAGLAWVVYPPAVLLSTWITAETMFTGLLLGSLVLLT